MYEYSDYCFERNQSAKRAALTHEGQRFCDECGEWADEDCGRKFCGQWFCEDCEDEGIENYLADELTKEEVLRYLRAIPTDEFAVECDEMRAFFDDEEIKYTLIGQIEKTWATFPPSGKDLVKFLKRGNYEAFLEWYKETHK